MASLTGGDVRSLDARRVTSSAIAKQLGRKRVRRIELEIPFFQCQVRDLKLKLKRIKLQRASPAVQRPNCAAFDRPETRVWDGIAERQLKERLRAERQQQELKNRRLELVKWAAELHKLLHKCGDSNELVARVGGSSRPKQRFWDFSMDPADEIFADQLVNVAKLFLQLQSTPSRALSPSSDLSVGREVVKWDPKVDAGFIMENRSGSLLPFSLEVAAQAYWRLFGCGFSERCCSKDASHLAANIVTRSFSLQTNFEGFTSSVWGKYTCRKYVDEDSVTLVSVGSGNVVEIGGATFNGVQLHKRGVITLRRVPRQGPGQISTSTVVETTFETTPVFHESVVDRAKQTETLIDEITKSYVKLNKSFCHRMGAVLLEEDWMATFGRETLRS
ncbi:hypothetical protein PHYBOEH_010399 [Phytophthora boehmeriae]|uniref:M96 mating-specific protein family n=1 Tax=Phytophthora boehmeriae TaxID=109152 RepID=A0A8T1VT40_9STRA|nr:hypothetical protein PHYBOEH_010399 [Phytophthora boehmeriae]